MRDVLRDWRTRVAWHSMQPHWAQLRPKDLELIQVWLPRMAMVESWIRAQEVMVGNALTRLQLLIRHIRNWEAWLVLN